MAETFLPFDLDAGFTASVNLLTSAIVYMKLTDDIAMWLLKSHIVFDELKSSGNLIAASQKTELLQLEDMLRHLVADHHGSETVSGQAFGTTSSIDSSATMAMPPVTSISKPLHWAVPHSDTDLLSVPALSSFVGSSLDGVFTSAQIMDLATSIDIGDTEWMSQAITDYAIW